VRLDALAVALVAAGAAVWLWLSSRARRAAMRRLEHHMATQPTGERRGPDGGHLGRPFPPRYQLAAPAAGAVVMLALRLAGLPLVVAGAVGTLAGVLAFLVEDQVAASREAEIEAQLSAAIDLLVGALRAGASLLAAFESALEEASAPLRPYLQEVAGRIRLGDDPRSAVSDLQIRVPLESFRLFSTSLAVHWEVGGSLATALTMVGVTVRDRIELTRRVRAQKAESNASVAVILVITYVLSFLMWRSNPNRIEAFVRTDAGMTLVAGAILLQAVGLVWLSRLSRSRF